MPWRGYLSSMGTDLSATASGSAIDPMSRRALMAELYEKASRWTPASLKDVVRRGATLIGCQIGRLPGFEALSTHLATLFARLKINCILDVGAHVGQYGRFLRNIGYKGHIVSFEPISANFAALEQRCASDKKWTARRLALGNEEKMVPINVAHITQFSSFLPRNRYSVDQFGDLSETYRTEMVEMERLDNIFEECTSVAKHPRVFLKLDTQGFDLKILEGCGECLDRVVAIQSELAVKPLYEGMTEYRAANSYMNERGFELTGLFPVLRDENLQIVELDSVMIRRRGSH
jgi:FkbM family methyltransferase